MDTLFMMTSKDYFFISSRTIEEVAAFHGSVSSFVPLPSKASSRRSSKR